MQARDTQRQKTYNWERKVLHPVVHEPKEHQLTLPECEKLIESAFTRYGLTPPKIHNGGGYRHAQYIPYWQCPVIVLPRWARTTCVVLHECAHGICKKYAPNDPGHGALFVRVFIDLIAHYGKLSATELSRSAKEARLKVAPATQCRVPNQTLVKRLTALRKREQEMQDTLQTVQNARAAMERKIHNK